MLHEQLRAGVQTVPHIVPVQEKTMHARSAQLTVYFVGNGTLAAAAQSGEPNDATAVPVQPLPILAGDSMFVPGDEYLLRHGLQEKMAEVHGNRTHRPQALPTAQRF